MVNSDEELFLSGRDGNEWAFKELIKRYQQPVYCFLYKMAKNHDDTADLMQQTFLQIFRKAEQFQEGTSFKAWLFTIASNTGKNHYRTVERRKESELVGETLADSATSGMDMVAKKQTKSVVIGAINQLPVRQKQTIELRIYREFTFDEIARVMSVTTGAAKANFHHGIKRLKQLLSGEPEV